MWQQNENFNIWNEPSEGDLTQGNREIDEVNDCFSGEFHMTIEIKYNHMKYTKVEVTVTPVNQIANDLLMAQMGELGFESFSETEQGFEADIPSKN